MNCGAERIAMLPVSNDTLLRVAAVREICSRSSASMTRLGDGTIDTPASSATWKDAGLSHFYRIASRRLPNRGSPLIRRSKLSLATVVVDTVKRPPRHYRTRYRSRIAGI
jgi:hypothetical protein